MNAYLQISRTYEPLLLPSVHTAPWLPKAKLAASAFSRAPFRRAMLRTFSHIDRQMEIHMNADNNTPQVSTWRFQRSLNVSSRWVTVAVVLAVFILKHDEDVMWALTGGVLNSLSSKLLKKLFNQQRPLTALGLKADPGMPSSHAQSFGFFGFYAAFSVMIWKGMNIMGVAASTSVFFLCIYLAWLRYAEGLHTLPQVVVGVGFGCFIAAVWVTAWQLMLKDIVSSSVVHHRFFIGLFALSVVGFIAFGLRKWRLGEA